MKRTKWECRECPKGNCSDCPRKTPRWYPEALDKTADKVLSYRAPARTKKAKKRQRARRKVQRESSI